MSLIDWGFTYSTAYQLDTSVYVSSPSSIRLDVPIDAGFCTNVLNKEWAMHMQQGRIVTQLRADKIDKCAPIISICTDNPLGQSSGNEGYMIWFHDDYIRIYRYLGSGWGTPLWEHAVSLLDDTWYQFRITWWTEGGHQFIRLEQYDGGWSQLGSDFEDTESPFSGNAHHTLGIGGAAAGNTGTRYVWFDDTTVYVKTPSS